MYIICYCVTIAVQQITKSDFDVLRQLLGAVPPRTPASEVPFPFNLASVKPNSWLRPCKNMCSPISQNNDELVL